MPSSLLSLFSQVSDPRRGQGKMYPLAPILLFTVLAMLAGARSYRQVHGFIRTHLDRLNNGFGVSLRRAPAYSSVRFILHGLDADEMERVFRAHAAGLAEAPIEGAAIPPAVADRKQGFLLPASLEDYVSEENPVRVIDAFVDHLDLAVLGFDGVCPKKTGRPSYHPSVLLTLYIYGYLI